MDRDKEVGLIFIGHIGPFFQRDKDIGLACIDHPHVGTILFHVSSEGQSHSKIDVFFFRESPQGSRIFPAMSGVDYQRKFPVCSIGGKRKEHEEKEKDNRLFTHIPVNNSAKIRK